MTEKIVRKGLVIRLYPTEEQKIFLNKSFGCERLFYNYLLNERNEFYKNEVEPIKDDEKLKKEKYKLFKPTSRKQFKEIFEFCKEPFDDCLCSSERNLKKAFDNYFESIKQYKQGLIKKEEIKTPKFKKKNGKNSYTDCHVKNNAFDFSHRLLNIGKCDGIKFRRREKLPNWYYENKCKLKSITLSKNSANEYYASLLFEYNTEDISTKLIDENQAIGLDWSTSDFYIDSDGKSAMKDFGFKKHKQGLYWNSKKKVVVHNKNKKKLTKLQRRLSKKKQGSKNYEKARIKKAKFERYIANSRKWWIENETNRLSDEKTLVCVEDLNLKSISHYLKNAKNVEDSAYGIFINRLEDKCEEKGTNFIKVDRYFPSSQLCSNCGFKNIKIKNLKIREWTCPKCGTFHNRDVNASQNLKNYGLKYFCTNETLGNHGVIHEGILPMSVEDVETLASLALAIGGADETLSNQEETERTTCERVHKAYSL